MEDSISAKVMLKVGDNITTDHIMPAGAKILPYRSNIALMISTFCFGVCDKEWKDAKEGDGIIIGGLNYGQGPLVSMQHLPHSILVLKLFWLSPLLEFTVQTLQMQVLFHFSL